MKFSLRNRIAVFYLAATGLLIGMLCLAIYSVVEQTVFSHLDDDLDTESNEVIKSLVILNDEFVIANTFEWNESEHGQIEVNPVFVQLVDWNGHLVKKTGNLLNVDLSFDSVYKSKTYFNTVLSGVPARQLQTPIKNPVGKTLGFIIVAMPLEESALVLANLRLILIVAFPLVLIALFFLTRLIAGRSISPINKVISSAEKITKENIDGRIDLPLHKDEIFALVSTINQLLDRIEEAVVREKQFTSDASHELRTPLAVLKGTLEVLIRKPRETKQYEEKISYCIGEVDRMSHVVEQLLLFARYESGKVTPMISKVDLNERILASIERLKNSIEEKRINIRLSNGDSHVVSADPSMLDIILENIISNGIKYSGSSGILDIRIEISEGNVVCSFSDYGGGMTEEQTRRIFDRFYRADESRNSKISGNGLGLSIVKKLAELQNINVRVYSEVSKGTVFTISIPQWRGVNR